MKRSHLTLSLVVLAGVAAWWAPRLLGRPAAAPAPESPILGFSATPPVALPDVIVPDWRPELPEPPAVVVVPPVPPVPVIPEVHPAHDGRHPIHVEDGRGGGLIPELTEPARPAPRPIVALPPDPPRHEDGCPACGMG